MPQMDIAIFFNQSIWFFVVFFFIYFLTSYCIVPNLNFIFRVRYNIRSVIRKYNSSIEYGDLFKLATRVSRVERSKVRSNVAKHILVRQKCKSLAYKFRKGYIGRDTREIYSLVLLNFFRSSVLGICPCF